MLHSFTCNERITSEKIKFFSSGCIVNLRKLFYSVRYTNLSQLLARIKLLIKRKFFEINSDFFNEIFEEKEVSAAIKNQKIQNLLSFHS